MQHVLLLDMAIHTLDAARFMSGKTPLAVYCLETNPKGSWYAHGAAANAIFEIRRRRRLHLSRLVERRGRPHQLGQRRGASSAPRARCSGTAPTTSRPTSSPATTASSAPSRPIEVLPADPAQTQGHASVIVDFVDCAREGRPPETVGSDNIKSLAMVFAAIESARPASASKFSTEEPSMTDPAKAIRIGTMIKASEPGAHERIAAIADLGFESFEPFFWQTTNGQDLAETGQALARRHRQPRHHDLDHRHVRQSARGQAELDRHDAAAAGRTAIDNAHHFGATCVAGFTGRVRGKPLTDSLPRYKEVWSELAKRAADKGVKIAFENCAMDGNWQTGDWNIAHNPDAWELIFNETPDDNIGLEWEPCHQLVYLIDPLPQIRKWAHKFFHVHGKDATVRWDVIREHGIFGKVPFVFMRTPGFGDTNWVDVISELRLAGYTGSIDIEGWHDPVYRDALEMTGQVRALNYLKDCRGGDFIAA